MSKTGLVLEGGGARGAYHLGAYKAIVELGIEIQGVTGSSAGALNGILIAQGDWEKAYQMWENLNLSSVVEVDERKIQEVMKLKLNSDQLSYMLTTTKKIWSDKGLDINPLKELIADNLNTDGLRNSNLDFGLTTYNYTDKMAIEIFKEDMADDEIPYYLIASASLPIFKNEPFKDKIYLDGYFTDNLPINMLLKKGYDDIIAVRTVRSDKLPAKLMQVDYDYQLEIIKPSQDLGGMMEFTAESISKSLKMGYFDAMRQLKKYRGRRYCITQWPEALDYLPKVWALTDETVHQWAAKLKLKQNKVPQRFLFEDLIPQIANLVGATAKNDYMDILLYTLETLAIQAEIDPFKFYTFEALKSEVLQQEAFIYDKLKRTFSLKALFQDEKKHFDVFFDFIKL